MTKLPKGGSKHLKFEIARVLPQAAAADRNLWQREERKKKKKTSTIEWKSALTICVHGATASSSPVSESIKHDMLWMSFSIWSH